MSRQLHRPSSRSGRWSCMAFRRSADRVRPFARRQFGHRRLHRPVASGPGARAWADAVACAYGDGTAEEAQAVHRSRRRHPPPAASVCGRGSWKEPAAGAARAARRARGPARRRRLEAATAASELAEAAVDSESPDRSAALAGRAARSRLEGIGDAAAAAGDCVRTSALRSARRAGRRAARRRRQRPRLPPWTTRPVATGAVVEVPASPADAETAMPAAVAPRLTPHQSARRAKPTTPADGPRDRFAARACVFGGRWQLRPRPRRSSSRSPRRRRRPGAGAGRARRRSATTTRRSTPSMPSTRSCSRSSRKRPTSCCRSLQTRLRQWAAPAARSTSEL